MSDYPGAIWMPNNNFFPNTGKKSFIILHGTAGGTDAEGIAKYFQGTEGTPNPVSSHYVVGKDGHVVQTIAESNGAYGNGVVTNSSWQGNPNNYTISIEHVKNQKNAAGEFDNSDSLTPAQQSASFALIKDICQRNGIGMHEADYTTGITGHFSIDPINRSRCPGTYPWDALWQYLGGNKPMTQVPTGWTDDGTTLKAPNGVSVVRGFRDHVLSSNWDKDNWPLNTEYAANPVEQSNPSLGTGTAQDFRWKRLEWTVKSGVIEGWTGQELVWCKQQNTQLQAQITTLQGEIAKLQALPIVANLNQIQSIGQTIKDDVDTIMKLAQVQ